MVDIFQFPVEFQLWIWMIKNSTNPLGAKNNDSLAEKQAIVKFYTPKYRKCGNFEK